MPEDLPIPSSDVPETPDKPKTTISLSDADLDAAGITESAVGDSVTLTITGRIVSDNQFDDSRNKSIEVDSISSSGAPTGEESLPVQGEDSLPPTEEAPAEGELPPVEPDDTEPGDEAEEKTLGYKRPKKKGKGLPIDMKKLQGGW